ncbi:MAG: adenylate/guanylate cyclase domain-containing protein, partial [Desulfatiglandales bacterium]
GNIGSPTRKSYVMVGDTVNLAARLQELNKEYGSDIIISEDCKNRLKDSYQFRDLGEVKVKGRESPVKIYAIL